MSFEQDLCEDELVRDATLNRRAIKRKAEELADEEMKEILSAESATSIKTATSSLPPSSHCSSLVTPSNDQVFVHVEHQDPCPEELPSSSQPFGAEPEDVCGGEAPNIPPTVDPFRDNCSSVDPSSDYDDDYQTTDDDGDDGPSDAHSHLYLPLLSVAHYLRDKMTKKSLSNHLKIQQITTKSMIKELRSPHTLLSKYKKISKAGVSKVQICRQKACSSALAVGRNNAPLPIQPCGHNHQEKQGKRACYVLHVSVEKQLIHFVKHHGLIKTQPAVSENVRSDVNSGSCYQSLRRQGVIDDDTITLQLNADGVQKHKMSNYSFWAFMAIINEVPYHIRRNFVILLSLWFGDRKPPREAFLTQSMEALRSLQENGFTVDGKTYKVRVLIVTTDTMARPVMRNTSQFNGSYGCDWCLMEGVTVKKGKGHTRVYPEPPPGSRKPSKRTLQQHLADIRSATKEGKPVHGVVGPTPLSLLPDFDFVKAFVPDYMHALCQGVFKHLIQLWTKAEWKKEPWFIGKKEQIETINRRLASSRPPYEISRTMDNIADLTDWKASMFRSFALYHFQLLEGVLPADYFRHYADIVYAVSALLRKEINVEDVRKVEILLNKTVVDMEKMYGKQHIRINVHFMTHLAQSVLDWGCLWATSNFIPEGFNGDLKDLSRGTTAVVEQMADNYLMQAEVRREAAELINRYELPHSVVLLLKDLLQLPDSLIGKPLKTKGTLANDGKARLLGKPSTLVLEHEDVVALLNLFGSHSDYNQFLDLQLEECHLYERVQLTSPRAVFTTTSYKRAKKSINYCALLHDGEFVLIERVLHFPSVPINRCFLICKLLGTVSKKTYTPKPIDGIEFPTFPGQTTKLFGVSKSPFAIDLDQIVSKCVLSYSLPTAELYVATALVNPFETD